MRFAIYARFSSDNQHDRSIDDQVRLCREHAANAGGSVAEVYADYARTGAHAASRPALQQMMADARAGRFDAVLAEALDRLSRDQEDIAGLHKRLAYLGIPIHTLGEGEITELHVGLKGTMNALFLKDLAQKVRRGARGRIEAGRSAGGLAYGYEVVKEYDDAGEPIRGGRRVNPDHAAVIRRIFAAYANGQSARDIAAGLNRDGIPSATGGAWRASTINGNRSRRSGMLYNEAYIGLLVYNRVGMVRDPDTGKRISRPNPPDDWVVVEAPELRIVDDETWNRVHAIKARYAHWPAHLHRRPRRLLSGLIRCGVCGGAVSTVRTGRYGCSAYREAKTCDNGHTVAVDKLEARVLTGLQERLLDPAMVTEFLQEYHRGQEERRRAARDKHRGAEREIKTLHDEIERIVDHMCAGTETPAMVKRLVAAEDRKAALERDLAAAGEPAAVIQMHPRAADLYREKIEALASALNADDERPEAIALLRSLVDRIVLHPTGKRGEMRAELHGRLAAALALANGEGTPDPESMLVMVAEARLRHQHTIAIAV